MEGGKRARETVSELTCALSRNVVLSLSLSLLLEMAKQKVNRKLKTETEKQSAKL